MPMRPAMPRNPRGCRATPSVYPPHPCQIIETCRPWQSYAIDHTIRLERNITQSFPKLDVMLVPGDFGRHADATGNAAKLAEMAFYALRKALAPNGNPPVFLRLLA